jgi:hypothetical protein
LTLTVATLVPLVAPDELVDHWTLQLRLHGSRIDCQ